jgi:hypothetical protein
MPTVSIAQQRVFWSILHEAGRIIETSEDREIVVMAPWISDLPMVECGWSPSSLESIYPESNGHIESLSDVLIQLSKIGYLITVVTLSTEGKWLTREQNGFADAERDFFDLLRPHDIRCRVVDDLHVKMLRTPFAVMSGSANFTRNGLFGRTRENIQVEHISQRQNFEQLDHIVSDFILASRDYFTRAPSILQRQPPVRQLEDATELETLPTIEATPLVEPSVLEGDYPAMVPTDYLPPGSILQPEQPSAEASLRARVEQHWQQICTFSHDLVVDELSDDFNSQNLTSLLQDPIIANSVEHIIQFFDDLPPGTVTRIQERIFLTEPTPWDEFLRTFKRIVKEIPRLFSHIESQSTDIRMLGIRVDTSLSKFNTLKRSLGGNTTF